MRKIIGFLCVMFAVLLAGCPTEVGTENGEDYVDAAVLLNEKAKYNTAIVFSFDESDAGTDVTEQFIQLLPGKTASREVAVSVSSISGEGYFTLQDGKLTFTGLMPPEGDSDKEIDNSEKEEEEIIEKSSISNGEIITLFFQKDGESAALEVLGIIERKGEENDAERIAVSEDNTFVLYGFDVIKSSYINRSDVKITRPILDVIKVNAADMIRQSTSTSSNWESATGESVTELFESLNASISAEYKGVVFSGKAEAEFSTSRESTETKRYAKGRGFQITMDEFLINSSLSILKTLLSDTFKTDINSMSAAAILDAYGTHLIARCYWGGSAEFNYSYTGTQLTTEQDIKVALNATYGGFTGTASTEAKNKANELNTNSTFTSSSRGGNNTAWLTVEQFTDGYTAWVQSVKNNPDICGIPNFNNDLIPIWTIAEQVNITKASQIKQEFDRRATERGIALEGYKYVQPAPTYSYVTAVDVRDQKSEGVPSGYTNIVKTDMYNPNAGGVLDANAGAGGAWIRIAYKKETGNSNHDAIAELVVVNTGNSRTPPSWSGWTTINFDLNKSAGGSYIWLLYRKVNSNDTMAIDFIGSYCESNSGSGQILTGYSWVSGLTDLNKGAGGKYIYLTVHKSPFKW
jgi:hypothetical protein